MFVVFVKKGARCPGSNVSPQEFHLLPLALCNLSKNIDEKNKDDTMISQNINNPIKYFFWDELVATAGALLAKIFFVLIGCLTTFTS